MQARDMPVSPLPRSLTPPSNLDAEIAVLGGLMFDPIAYDRIADRLHPQIFSTEAHRTLCKAIVSIRRDNSTRHSDMLTVISELSSKGELEKVGGKLGILRIVDMVITAANVDQHMDLLIDKFVRRQAIALAQNLRAAAYDHEPIAVALDRASEGLVALSQEQAADELESLVDIWFRAFPEVEARQENPGLIGESTGLYDLDAMLGGLQPGALITVAARPAMGKCLGYGTKVLMFDGTLKAVQDVEVGDRLMGPDSKPRNVLDLCRGRSNMYWIRQSKGLDYRVNEDHVLSLKASGTEGTRKHGEVVNVSVKEFLSKSNKFRIRHKGYKACVNFPEQSVAIDPYLLGLWLGDGKSSSSDIYNPDREVIEFLHKFANEKGCRISEFEQKGCKQIRVCRGDSYSFIGELRGLDLIGNKHIPQCYMSNSLEYRLNLLAGILDADGHYCSTFNCFEVTQKRQSLAEQIKFVADTLGFRTSLVKKRCTIRSIGFSGDYYRVRISGDLHTIPTKIKRKQAREYIAKRDWRVTGIKVEPDGVDNYYGFSLDGDRLFLLEDMTVTHNSSLVMQIADHVSKSKPVAVFSLEMSKFDLVYRAIASASGVSLSKIRSGQLNAHEMNLVTTASAQVSDRFWISENPCPTVVEINAQARSLKIRQGGLGAVIVDYLQLMGTGTDNRVQELSKMTRSLKIMARTLDVPVVILSQLSRAVESRQNKRPMQSDLRESGAIEQDSDQIIFLYRDEYYNPDTSERGICELIVAKNRNGPVGTVKVLFEPHLTRFRNLAGGTNG